MCSGVTRPSCTYWPGKPDTLVTNPFSLSPSSVIPDSGVVYDSFTVMLVALAAWMYPPLNFGGFGNSACFIAEIVVPKVNHKFYWFLPITLKGHFKCQPHNHLSTWYTTGSWPSFDMWRVGSENGLYIEHFFISSVIVCLLHFAISVLTVLGWYFTSCITWPKPVNLLTVTLFSHQILFNVGLLDNMMTRVIAFHLCLVLVKQQCTILWALPLAPIVTSILPLIYGAGVKSHLLITDSVVPDLTNNQLFS